MRFVFPNRADTNLAATIVLCAAPDLWRRYSTCLDSPSWSDAAIAEFYSFGVILCRTLCREPAKHPTEMDHIKPGRRKGIQGIMKIGNLEFNLRELAGSMGDFGTLLPLAIGYITVCGVNPAGLLVMMGLANIATGLVYRLPMPIEPMKVLAIMAIAQAWTPEKVYTSGIVMGIIWLGMGLTGLMSHIARWTPKTVVTGIQISLGFLLAFEGIKLMSGWWLIGLISVVIIIILHDNRFFPAAIMLVMLGVVIMAFKGNLQNMGYQGVTLPSLVKVYPKLIWPVLRDGGLAQIPLTATNAVIATSALISQYWPDRRVSERQLSINMGLMNLTLPFFGGMPLCHGAGGLAGQYFFGARTVEQIRYFFVALALQNQMQNFHFCLGKQTVHPRVSPGIPIQSKFNRG